MLKRILFSSVLIFTVFACGKDDNNSSSDYRSGTFIVNEGVFGSGTGTITYLGSDTQTDDLYAQQNGGQVLGNIAQSMIKFDNKYFIAVNNGAKIVVVNAADFKYIGEIKIDLPRYFTSSGGKLYASSWSSDFSSGFINLINAKNLTIEQSTPVNGLVERMIIADNNLYATVSATEYDQFKNHVVQYDIQKDEFVGAIEVGDNSNDIIQDKNGDIWVLCSGLTDWSDFTKNTAGSLHKISGNKSVFNMPLNNGVNKITANKNKDILYFLDGANVISFDVNAPNPETKSIYSGFYYGIAANPINDQLYLLNAKDYLQNGEVTILDKDYKAVSSHKTGIIPTFVYFSN